MPTYEYRCPAGHEFELFQKMSDKPRTKCPECGRQASRQISAGAGLHFKGSGFYITDYGKDGKGPRKADKTDAAGAEPKPETKVESKTAPDPSAAAKPSTEKPADKPAGKKAKE
jgi:putative FmdB family regulatory protein